MPDLLKRLMELSSAATEHGPVAIDHHPGSAKTSRATGGKGSAAAGGGAVPPAVRDGVRLVSGGRLIGLVRSSQLARWCVEGPRWLRATVEALAVEWDAHAPRGGICPVCHTPAPCDARQRMTHMLVHPRRKGLS